jgi:lactoylglutathione lyase
MKGLAFVLDPDGYWIEIIRRNENSKVTENFNYAQTMFRIKDPIKSLKFYRG